MVDLPDLALSVRQPWAWAIIHAGKDVENRGVMSIRHMRLDGVRTLAIHAAKGMTRDEYDDARDFMTSIGVACPAMADGSLEWAAYDDWRSQHERARFFGFASRELPASMTS